ncbi:transposase [Pseudozobellia thermophila]|uniref:Transposase n=1 Tax=Pseudozobellia thermophila TaxID=192903 RepID=A0A1M6NUM0_9FLAO|nr:transposase [Pseudozobellia thermophila]SHJ92383.1 transposase [Pseudozobellia thermophila]SHJ99449.1 transposase [Pseudozobellia thermophila]
MTRRKFTSKFKTKVVLEALKERHSLAELAQKHGIHPTQISSWKRDFLSGAEQVFEKGKTDKRSEAEKKNDQLLKTIGELKVENDFLKDALR